MGLMHKIGVLCLTCVLLLGGCKKDYEETLSTVTLQRSYRNPITQKIEDAGGENGEVTGQAMVEGTVFDEALLEHTSKGNYYLTFRMGLIDFSSKYIVQYYDGKKFVDATAFVASKGKNDKGTTYAICCKVPKEDTVLRVSMFVEPMGRDVIFFLKPEKIVGGNHTDFIPQYVSDGAKCDIEVKDFGTSEKTSVGSSAVVSENKGLILSTDRNVQASSSSSHVHYIVGGVLFVFVLFVVLIHGKGKCCDDDEEDEEE